MLQILTNIYLFNLFYTFIGHYDLLCRKVKTRSLNFGFKCTIYKSKLCNRNFDYICTISSHLFSRQWCDNWKQWFDLQTGWTLSSVQRKQNIHHLSIWRDQRKSLWYLKFIRRPTTNKAAVMQLFCIRADSRLFREWTVVWWQSSRLWTRSSLINRTGLRSS